jgi:hypothetical protein
MQVVIHLTEDDLWRFTRRTLWGTPTTRRNLIGSVLAVPLVSGVVALLLPLPPAAAAATVVLATAAGLPLLWWVTRRQVIRLAQPGTLGEHVISLTEDGVRERTAVNESTTAWSVIEVDRDEHALYLRVGPMVSHVIPWRSFASEAEAQAFEDGARSRARTARERV